MVRLGQVDCWQGSAECSPLSSARRTASAEQKVALKVTSQQQTRDAVVYVILARPRLVLLENVEGYVEQAAVVEAVKGISGYEWRQVLAKAEDHGWIGARAREWVVGRRVDE